MYLVLNYANYFPCISEPCLIIKLTKCPARCQLYNSQPVKIENLASIVSY